MFVFMLLKRSVIKLPSYNLLLFEQMINKTWIRKNILNWRLYKRMF